MPFARIDDTDTQFYYQDSGKPALEDKPYTTLVIVHGFGFNGHIFHRLLPLAMASHLRLVLLNRRGYAGSTPLREDETSPIDPLVTSSEDMTSSGTPRSQRVLSGHYMTFLQQRGAELARFLAWFIENEKIPPRTDESIRASGGISLLGWSLGNATALSLLGFANTFDPRLMQKLEAYLRRIIIFDPPHHALGFPTPDNFYNPLFAPEIPAEQRQTKFGVWVSSYFTHAPSIRDPEAPLRDFISGLAQRETNSSKVATSITPADKSACLEAVNPSHGDAFSLAEHAFPVHEVVRNRAIFGNYNETAGAIVLPKVDISYVWCTESIWEAVLAMRLLRDTIASPPAYLYPVRTVKFFPLEGGNHFIFYDDPLKAIATFAQALE